MGKVLALVEATHLAAIAEVGEGGRVESRTVDKVDLSG
jgi:hypothetical protein